MVLNWKSRTCATTMKILFFLLSACVSWVSFTPVFADESVRELDFLPADWGMRHGWSVDSSIEEAQVIALVRLKTPGSYSGFGLGYMNYNDAEMEVQVSILGKPDPTIKGFYRIHTDYAKSNNPLKVGTTMIIVGYYYENQPELTIRRYIYPTPENMKRVVASIRQWHGKKLAEDPEGTARLEKALAANLDAYQPPTPPPSPAGQPAPASPPPSGQEWPLWLGGMLVLALMAVGWWRWRRSSNRC